MGMTGQIFNGFTFDGESSKDYGVYITGSGVFNAPERDVEMITIPGRDGAFALDRGHFSNIEVTYPAGLYGVDKADFADAISNLRNFLASRQGYCQLSDDYNPGEYREAVFKSGLEVTPANLESGEFDITFECKPQRWLTSGEDAVSITSGDDISNPTLFDARPLLVAQGAGTIVLGADEIILGEQPIGDISIFSGETWTETTYSANTHTIVLNITAGILNAGDAITFPGLSFVNPVTMGGTIQSTTYVSRQNGSYVKTQSGKVFTLKGTAGPNVLTYGTATSWTAYCQVEVTWKSGGSETVEWPTIDLSFSYNGSNRITITTNWNYDSTQNYSVAVVIATSSQNALAGKDIYIDLDIGEAYVIDNGSPVSVNGIATIPATLPTLPPGNTEITYDNTITQFKVVPRWWKV